MREIMMISAIIPKELNELRKKKGMTWSGVIKIGLQSGDIVRATEEIMAEYQELKAKQARTAAMLQKYIDETREV